MSVFRDLNNFDNRMIDCETALLDAFNCDDRKEFTRMVYGETDCGAAVEFHDGFVVVSSIVEGSDAEFSETFSFPFQSDALFNYIDELEAQVEEAWNEANSTESDE
jgi:hypothetical protein